MDSGDLGKMGCVGGKFNLAASYPALAGATDFSLLAAQILCSCGATHSCGPIVELATSLERL